MIRGIFITGTDTGVGKTFVAAGLLRCLRAGGMDIVPMKPVQTGAGPREDSADLQICLSAARMTPPPGERALMEPYRFEPACAPHLAARMTGRPVEIDRIIRSAEELCKAHEAVIVEGAGGTLVPLDDIHTMRDLMRAMGLPVLVVSRNALGSINHTLLTIEALRNAGILPLGVIMNRPHAGGDFTCDTNPEAVARFGRVPILGSVGFLSADRSTHMWTEFEHALHGLPAIAAKVAAQITPERGHD